MNQNQQTIEIKEKQEIIEKKQLSINQIDIGSEEKLPRLRPRLVKFCEAKVEGKTDAESYRIAGFKAKNEQVASSLANRLLKNESVKEYLRQREFEIAEKLRKETNVSRVWVLRKLQTCVEKCETANKHRELVAATAEINRMQGYLAPAKFEGKVEQGNKSFDVSKLPYDDIVTLSEMFNRVKKLQDKKVETSEPVG
jgi:hypothetical protein